MKFLLPLLALCLTSMSNMPMFAASNGSISAVYDTAQVARIHFLAADAHIHEIYMVGGNGTWIQGDLIAEANAITPAAGTAVSAVFDPPSGTPRTNFVGSDSHLHQLYIASNAWHDLDLTAASGAPNPGSGTSISAMFDPANGNTPRINYVATDSHLHQVWLNSGNWTDADLTASLANPDVAAGSAISAFYDASYSTPRVHYIATDSHLHQLYIASGTWHDSDLTVMTGAPLPAAGTSISGMYDNHENLSRVNYVATDSHVHQAGVFSGTWNDFDLTNATKAVNADVKGSISAVFDSSQNVANVNYIATDSHVHQFYINYTPPAAWLDRDLTAISGASRPGSDASVSALFDVTGNTPRVAYLGSDSHLHAFYETSSTWPDADLTAAAGGPSAWAGSYTFTAGGLTINQGTTVVLGPYMLAMQGDGNFVLYLTNGPPVWNSGTYGQNCSSGQCHAVFQGDGNLVVYNGSVPIWSSQTAGSTSAQLVITAQAPYLDIIGSPAAAYPAREYIYMNGKLVAIENWH